MPLAAESTRPPLVPVSDEEIPALLRALVAEHGLTGAARILGITREPIARELAGIATRNGTRAQLRERLSLLRNR